MTKRTRNHIIEDESRLNFKKILPEYWVCRDKNNDYGIDCEVEIFDNQGNTTGLVFWVQLKGTDSDKKNVIQSISFPKDKLIQFDNYEIPVLIVRYSTKEKKIYFKWSKSIIWDNPNNKNIKVEFNDNNIWNKDSHNEIVQYIQKQQLIKQGKIRFPIKTFINRNSSVNKNEIPYSNIIKLKKTLADYKKYISFSSEPSDSMIFVIIENDRIIISICDLGISIIKINIVEVNESSYEKVAQIILINIANCLFQIGKIDLGNDLLFENNLLSLIKHNKDFLSTILPHLINGNYFNQTINELTTYIKETEDDNIIQILTNVLLLSDKKDFDEKKLDIVEKFLINQIEFAKKRKDNMAIGTAHYNLANHYRSINENDLSIKFFLLAKKYNPFYKTHSYFYYELAGVLFKKGKYKFAIKFYSKSIDLKTDYFLAKALLADSLLYNGEYKKAMEVLNEYLNEQNKYSEYNDEWHLKYSCLATFLAAGYPESQIRNTEEAHNLLKKGDFEKALEFDLLSDLAWFNIGIKESISENILNSFLAFTFSALLCKNDVEAWTNATIYSFNEEIEMSLLVNVIRVAYFYNGEVYLDHLHKQLKKSAPEEMDLILELVDKIVNQKIKEPKIIRIFNSDGTYTTVTL